MPQRFEPSDAQLAKSVLKDSGVASSNMPGQSPIDQEHRDRFAPIAAFLLLSGAFGGAAVLLRFCCGQNWMEYYRNYRAIYASADDVRALFGMVYAALMMASPVINLAAALALHGFPTRWRAITCMTAIMWVTCPVAYCANTLTLVPAWSNAPRLEMLTIALNTVTRCALPALTIWYCFRIASIRRPALLLVSGYLITYGLHMGVSSALVGFREAANTNAPTAAYWMSLASAVVVFLVSLAYALIGVLVWRRVIVAGVGARYALVASVAMLIVIAIESGGPQDVGAQSNLAGHVSLLLQFSAPIAFAAIIMRWVKRRPELFVRGENQCEMCGYDLTGNVSGRCPECGREVSGESTVQA